MRRRKEREHNIEFLKNVVTALKIKDDPIKIATKDVSESIAKKVKSANQNLLEQDDESESESEQASEVEGRDNSGERDSVDSAGSAESNSSNASNKSVSYDPDGKKRKYKYKKDEYFEIDPVYYDKQLSTAIKKKSNWRWHTKNIDMEVFDNEEKKHKKNLQQLGIKINKFIAKRNISFNQELVFERWKEETEEWR